VDLYFTNVPKDFMTKFIDCLIQLPNLRTLEVFDTSDFDPVIRGLKQVSARFPGIRELGINDNTAVFAGNCPNVETITALFRLSWRGATILGLHGGKLKKLKKVVGIDENFVRPVVQGCPDLQEIGIKASTNFVKSSSSIMNVEGAKHLRALKHLAVVELDYDAYLSPSHRNIMEPAVRRDEQDTYLKEWTKHVIPVLKDSPSKERKFLRWRFSEINWVDTRRVMGAVENGELEVHPETPLE